MTIAELNSLRDADLEHELQKCCGAEKWVKQLMYSRPFADSNDLFAKADAAWRKTAEKDWLEAFSHHPKIGDLESLQKKFGQTKELAASEQSSVTHATQQVLEELAKGNVLYETKFGFIFIVCATGKSATEMLALLNARLKNDRNTEFKTATEEQRKIFQLRLQKMIA
jgi:2-oxo-4-hydroxy-4-carboxy-5-ureidoimidazoline decarboxylase